MQLRESSYPFSLGDNEDIAFKAGLIPILSTLRELEASGKDGVMATAKEAFLRYSIENNWINSTTKEYELSGNRFKIAVVVK